MVDLVRSLKLNLSEKSYLNNKVKLTGTTNDDGVFQANGITVIEVIKSDEDSELVEYKNTDLGFKLKYYNDWELKDSSASITFLNSFGIS